MKNLYLEEARPFINNYFNYEQRNIFVRKYSWSIPNEEAITEIVKCGPIIECGAGTGYWAKLIDEMGGDIICYDIAPPITHNNYYKHTVQYYNVEHGSIEVLDSNSDRSLMLSWAPYDNDMGHNHIVAYRGNNVILIGEGPGGCCGNDKMFEYLHKHFIKNKIIEIPQWYGIHDYVAFYQRKQK